MTLNVCTLQLFLSTLMRRQLVRWPSLLRQICSQIANTMQNSKTYKTAIISRRLQEMRRIFGEILFPKIIYWPKTKTTVFNPTKTEVCWPGLPPSSSKKHYTLWENDRHYLALKRILYSAVKYTPLITTLSSLQNELESHCTKYKGELRSEQESSGWNNVNCKQFKEVPAETEMHETYLLTKFGYWEFKGLEAFVKEDTDACLTGLYEVTPQAEAVESNIGKLLHT